MTAVLFLSGCAKYAKQKDLTELQQKAQENDKDINERLSRIEQTPKADPVVLAALAERVEKISMYALELERRVQATAQAQAQIQADLQPQMTLGVKPVSAEEIAGLVKKIDDLDGKIKIISETKKITLNSISFPLGKYRVEDLSGDDLSKLKENAARIREEKPSTVEIVTWADGSGAPEKKEKAASERARSIEAYYRKNAGEGANIQFLTTYKIASSSGPYWRRAETTITTTQKPK